MSRCFPFPPPGCEKKPQSNHADLLTKKQKENHKEEKRDKEKREGKERKDGGKDKDRSKDKHREKKDKKDKHRDKERKKDKDTKKDEKRILYERKDGHTEGHSDWKPGEESHQAQDLKNPRFVEELGRRIRDEDRGMGNQVGENAPDKVQGNFEGMGSSAEIERIRGNGIVPSITIPEQRRVGMAGAMEEKGADNEMAQNLIRAEQRRLDGMRRPMDKDTNKKIDGKEKSKEQEVDGREDTNKKIDGKEKSKEQEVDGRKDTNKKIDGKEKSKEQEADGRKGDRHKDKDKEKRHKEKDKVRNKDKEKEEKIREKGEHKHKGQDKLRDGGKKEQLGSQNVVPSFPPKDSVKSAGADGYLKRKEANGFLHENEVRPSKLSRPSSSQFSLENGNKSDDSHIVNLCASDRRENANMVNVEKALFNKKHKINGVIDVHSSLNMWRPSLIADATENGETSKKSPHPDEKLLSQILCVPKMEEWPEFADQGWLLSGDDLRQKPKTKLQADETPKVWAEAVRIESADVLALPYVIPY